MEANYENDEGVRWMLAWQAGDEAAFDRIVEHYSPQVYALLTRFLGPREGREDLVQEVFLRLLRNRNRYEPSARFSTFLYRIVFNLSVNQSQRVIAREALSLEANSALEEHGGEFLAQVEDSRSGAPSDGLEQKDVVQAVRAAIEALPENQRMALILAKYEDMPYAEIATVLGSSEKAVKSLIHRARESLRERLAPYLREELA
jgi:RNA polymerase sigma-70 factor, ECF subfamily